MPRSESKLPARSSRAEVDDFLAKVSQVPPRASSRRGRLMFAMDATASREPTWDRACHIQGEMFESTAGLGGLDVQLVFYRGFREFDAGPWVGDANALLARMSAVRCLGGMTQIGRVLTHARNEHARQPVHALVFVGDCIEEAIDPLCHTAGELGLLGVPVFVFQEGGDLQARRAFEQIAKLSRGAYCPFDASSAGQLKDLLAAVAVYAVGGRGALEDFGKRRGGAVARLTHQVGGG